MRIAWEGRELYCHISTKAGFDPVKTLYVCAPGADAASYEAAARFAQASGGKGISDEQDVPAHDCRRLYHCDDHVRYHCKRICQNVLIVTAISSTKAGHEVFRFCRIKCWLGS